MSVSKKRLKELRAIKDSAIDTSDIPELDESFWKKTKVHVPKAKTAISIRLDPEVLEWFRSQGKGYQIDHERSPKILRRGTKGTVLKGALVSIFPTVFLPAGSSLRSRRRRCY